ncbi:Nif3-like dinuclear metal center hexameric protein [Virgibacillus sp. C22-A2]|uniref:GTP cyclohydrolase 1 type 2 homolog n=1 Tax=Virgibacillus tibetensis TaxID=3042313 RepID=A0ABU6KBF1_9BACI|nr:Nif3-like dinuclear metal center hexameric protein [Virgibacillus sp. C22-A2]
MKRILNNSDVFQIMEEWGPRKLAYNWDNVGLQIGSHASIVKKIMITLDVLESVVDEAIEKNVNLIIAHHPLLFKPLKQVNVDSPQGRTIEKLIKHNITVYASHTNLDIANGGVNDILCDLLKVESTDVLVNTHTQKLVKVVVFVPLSHAEEVREAIGDSSAGHIGNYSHCTFQTEGQGTFKPLEGANPSIGNINQMEFVDEVKIETIVPEEKLQPVINAMIRAHPYEEVAYDIYPMDNKGETYGIGRIGTMKNEMSLEQFSNHVKSVFGLSHVKVTGDLKSKVKKVAVLGGSGEKYLHAAKQKGADVYVTGDMTFHAAQDAWQMGLSVIDPGHYIENIMKKAAKQYIEKKVQNNSIEVVLSESNTNPFQIL